MDKLLKIEDVAERTGLPVTTWRRWVHQKTGPQPARLGRRLVWRESQITAWLDDQFAAAAANERR